MFFVLSIMIVHLQAAVLSEQNRAASEQNKPLLAKKPLYTLTPKPSITKFRRSFIGKSLDNAVETQIDNDLPLSVVEEIKQQLTSAPMVLFYVVICSCIIVAVGYFMFSKDADDTIQDEKIEDQLNEQLDPQLVDEQPVQI